MAMADEQDLGVDIVTTSTPVKLLSMTYTAINS